MARNGYKHLTAEESRAMPDDTLCSIQARDAQHDWDSDYVGSESMPLSEARLALADLRHEAETDPGDAANAEERAAGLSDGKTHWGGWTFRIVAQVGGCYGSVVEA